MTPEYVLERINELEQALVHTRTAVMEAVRTGFPTEAQLSRLLYQVEMLKMWRMLHVHLLDNIPVEESRDRVLKWAAGQHIKESSANGLGHFGVAIALLKTDARESFKRSVPLL